MRIAAKSELQRAESPVDYLGGAGLVAALPFTNDVLNDGLGAREVASQIQE